MDNLALAVRQYERLVDRTDRDRIGVPRKILIWLKTDVCPAVQKLIVRPSFQDLARWPLDALVPGTETAERAAIERVSVTLQECARALVDLRLEPHQWRGATGTSWQFHDDADFQVVVAQVENVAAGRVVDLVNPEDYFEPAPVSVELEDGTRLPRSETIVSLNPELLPIGNFIVRRLMQGLHLQMDPVERLKNWKLHQIAESGSSDGSAVNSCWLEVCSARDELVSLLEDSELHSIRNAAIVAVQTLNAFGRASAWDWIGVSEASVQRGKHALRHRLTGRQGWDVADRIAAALQQLLTHYKSVPPLQIELEQAIASGGLVIDLGTREAYWQREKLKVKLTTITGKLLVAMAREAKTKRPASSRDVYGEKPVTDSAISTAAERLKRDLPSSLREKIRAVSGVGYQLDIHPREVAVFGKAAPASSSKSRRRL